MNVSYPVAIKRLHGQGIVKVAAKHNLREIAAEIGAAGHIDPDRISSNLILRGPDTAEAIAKTARQLMNEAGIVKLRVDAVMGLELLFTLPSNSNIDVSQYFVDATHWAEAYYSVPILSSVVHLDESSPHCHVLLLPLVDGKMVGSDLHGHANKLRAMQADFHAKVGSRYGYTRPMPKTRHTAAQRKAAVQLARENLQIITTLDDAIIDVLLEQHLKDPEPLIAALGLVMPASKAKATRSFVQIMTRPIKRAREQLEDVAVLTHLGLGKNSSAAKLKPYPCVGFGFPIGLQYIEQRSSSPNSSHSSASIYAPIDWPQIVVGRQDRDPSQADSVRR